MDRLGHRTRDRISLGKRGDSGLASRRFCDGATHLPVADFPLLALFEACPCNRRFAVGFTVHSTRHRWSPGHGRSFFFLVIVLRVLFVSQSCVQQARGGLNSASARQPRSYTRPQLCDNRSRMPSSACKKKTTRVRTIAERDCHSIGLSPQHGAALRRDVHTAVALSSTRHSVT